MMRVGYVVVRENLGDPLVQSQCLDVIEAINRSWGDGEVELIWFYRIDYLFRKGNPQLAALRHRLSASGIRSRFIPFVSLGFPVSWWILPCVLPQWLLGVSYLRYVLGFRSLHCRSYHAGVIGCVASKLFGMKYVFDPRSPFPEENVSAKRWGRSSLSNRLWKKLETYIINGSSTTIIVSPRLLDLYHGLRPECRFRVIQNNYPAVFESEQLASSTKISKRYTLVYVGSFGNWNKPGPYLRLLSILNRIGEETCNMLFIVRTEAAADIEQEAMKYGVDRSLFNIVTVSQSQVAGYLKQCRYGVYLMEVRDPRLGVKTVEYIAMGLPVIVSEHILGAAELVRTEGLGVPWDHSDDGVRTVYDWLQSSCCESIARAQRCMNFANAHFSPRVIAGKVVKVYEEVAEE